MGFLTGELFQLLADVVFVGLPPGAVTDAGEGGAASVDGFLIGTPPAQCRREPAAVGAVLFIIDASCFGNLLFVQSSFFHWSVI